jgi:NAD-dependent dihydropyrimidine dehydrogenase PreA subunit
MGICDITNQPELRWENECILCMACRDICPVNAISLNTIARSQV